MNKRKFVSSVTIIILVFLVAGLYFARREKNYADELLLYSLIPGYEYSCIYGYINPFRNMHSLSSFFEEKDINVYPSVETITSYIQENQKEFFTLTRNCDENPDTYMELSAIGFDSNKSQALVYVHHQTCVECSYGSLYFFVKKNDDWEMREEYTLFMT